MKSIKFFFQILSVVAFILSINPTDANAQDAQSRDVQSRDGDRATYCFDMVPSTKSALQTEANRTCNTQKSTIYCHDVTTKTNMFVTLIVQPATDGCSSTIKVTDDTVTKDSDGTATKITDDTATKDSDGTASAPLSRGYPMPRSRGDVADISVQVLQRQCPNGGVILSAYVPGNDYIDGKSDYDFVWTREGREVGTDMQLDCGSAKNVTLKVTNIATEQSVTKNITLDQAAKKR